ncbi:hypothetical protein [Inhella sp.]|uniref:hypothetical protein n=1 Tax=Inhella sp. TaxID=1921806 RepID=UPI0035B1EA0C
MRTLRFVHGLLFAACLHAAIASAAPASPSVKAHDIQFAPGTSRAEVSGAVKGYESQDFRLMAAAGQTLQVNLKSRKGALQFNVISPGSNEAMFIGETAGSKASLVLPMDGVYTIRTYLMRSAARRNESAPFSLAVSATGAPLPALPGAQDAKVSGTPFHATASLRCKPPYGAAVTQCEAGVIRRGHDGTATVEVRGPNQLLRQILLVKGRAVASNVALKIDSKREGDTVVVDIDGQERYVLPDAFLSGG